MEKNQKLTLIKEFRKKTNERNTPSRLFGQYICYCGNKFEVLVKSIKNGNTKSCGCLQKQKASQAKKTHGLSNHPIYKVWAGMKTRCNDKNNYHYEWYGARGIKICKEWEKSFIKFYDWAKVNGWKKSLELDRIDNDGNYDPFNCWFVTKKENLQNTRELIKTNTSGHRNIYPLYGKYRVIVEGKHIGMYDTLKEAKEARQNSHTRKFNA